MAFRLSEAIQITLVLVAGNVQHLTTRRANHENRTMKATLFIFLILGAVFFFAGNQVLTVGDLVLVLVIFWLWHWQAKKRVKEQEEQKEQQRIEAFNADYKPPAEQDVAELNEWRKSQGYPPLSAWELGARSVLPNPSQAKDSSKNTGSGPS